MTESVEKIQNEAFSLRLLIGLADLNSTWQLVLLQII